MAEQKQDQYYWRLCLIGVAAVVGYAVYTSLPPSELTSMTGALKQDPNAGIVGLYNFSHNHTYHVTEIRKMASLAEDVALEFLRRYYAKSAPLFVSYDVPERKEPHKKVASDWIQLIYKQAYAIPDTVWKTRMMYGNAVAMKWGWPINMWLATHGMKNGLPFSRRFDLVMDQWDKDADEPDNRLSTPERLLHEKKYLGNWIGWYYAKDKSHYYEVFDDMELIPRDRTERWPKVEEFLIRNL